MGSAWPPSLGHRRQARGRAGDRQVALLVGPQDPHAEPVEHGERRRRGMAVVVLADADQRDSRADLFVQGRGLLGGAVVRDLDDVHRADPRDLPRE
jgi:hypothetical protein